jgi:hypothetical protein
MFKVQYKAQNAFQSWANYGLYGSEAPALSVATRIRSRYFMVRVIDRSGMVVYVS